LLDLNKNFLQNLRKLETASFYLSITIIDYIY